MKKRIYIGMLLAMAVFTACDGGGDAAPPAVIPSGTELWYARISEILGNSSLPSMQGLAVDPTGLYVVGYDTNPGDSQWRIEKRSLTDGSRVAAFGTDGAITSNPSVSDDSARAIAVDTTGFYVVGYDSSPGDSQWRIEKRSLADGSLIAAFGTGGVVTSNPSASKDIAISVVVDSTGLYVVGLGFRWRIEKRNLTDGSLIAAFGAGGVVASNPSASNVVATGVAVDSTNLYVVGYDTEPGDLDSQWRIEKRSLADGSLFTAFGTGGVVTSNPSTSDDRAMAVAVDSTGLYVVGFDSAPSAYTQWRIEKRSLADGSLIAAFGTGGIVASDPSASYDRAMAVVVDSTGLYVVGDDESHGWAESQWRIEKRNLTDGSLDAAFGRDGVVTRNGGLLDDRATSIAVDSTGLYIGGYGFRLLSSLTYESDIIKLTK